MTKKYTLYGLMGFLLLWTACAKPVAQFKATTLKATAPAKIYFHNQSRHARHFEWSFEDGPVSKDSSVNHVFYRSGQYTVTLKAVNGYRKSVFKQKIIVDAPLECMIEIETDFGTMVAVLHNATPQHRDNFTKLVEEGYYNDLLFHRVIADFMIQGGDPNSKDAPAGQPLGMGGPGYQVPAEFDPNLVHIKGALAAARTNNPEKASSGSQFYIVQGKPMAPEQLAYMEAQKGIRYTPEQRQTYETQGGTPFLDGEYTVFGQVIQGLEVIDKITAVQKDGRDRPLKDVKMKIRLIK